VEDRCIIVGGGHAGSQAAVSLRQEGYEGEIVLVDDEGELPYHKPPLSKSYLKSDDASSLMLRPQAAYDNAGVIRMAGVRAERILPSQRRLQLAGGSMLDWTSLVLATGARARIPALPGVALDGVFTLRRMDDARRIRAAIGTAGRVVIVGGGFIGMEMAHSCVGLGKATTLVEAAPRILARSVAPAVSAHMEARSRAAGIDIRTDVQLAAIEGDGRVRAIVTASGDRLEADMVILGIGAAPDVALAAEAGLALDNGIAVDGHLHTSVAGIYAIGDCASFEDRRAGRRIRLESVQNATSQARHVARVLAGKPQPYDEVAWFWSDQGDMKLQTAGLAFEANRWVVSGKAEENAFSVYHFDGARLLAVDSVNRPAEHMVARNLLAAGIDPSEDDIAAGPQHLKRLAAGRSGG